ncbi:MAG: Protein MioC [Candidatus Erwinia impunctatus]|nr:Protein MioC [Culicoides impunctatus]
MTEITLITGSTLGSAEYVAEHLAGKLEEDRFSITLHHGPEADEIEPSGVWLIVASTHGAGDLPENLQPFFEALQSENPDLSQVSYGAVGLGSREYDLFCGAIKKLDQLLQSLGAKKIGERLEIDVTEHDIPEDPAEVWLESWKKQLS